MINEKIKEKHFSRKNIFFEIFADHEKNLSREKKIYEFFICHYTFYPSSQIFIAQLILVTEYELRGTSFGLPGLKNVFSVMILVEFESNLEQKYSNL